VLKYVRKASHLVFQVKNILQHDEKRRNLRFSDYSNLNNYTSHVTTVNFLQKYCTVAEPSDNLSMLSKAVLKMQKTALPCISLLNGQSHDILLSGLIFSLSENRLFF
jgi:hypothetical protein